MLAEEACNPVINIVWNIHQSYFIEQGVMANCVKGFGKIQSNDYNIGIGSNSNKLIADPATSVTDLLLQSVEVGGLV